MSPVPSPGQRRGLRVTLRGVVQGVGMRPFVLRLARSEGLAGRVWNDDRGVTIEAFGDGAALDRFLAELRARPPPAARLEEIGCAPLPPEPAGAFFILESPSPGPGVPDLSIPPDLATCPDCLAELRTPSDRRFRYPFTNCTACGPRYTIALGVPYDRARTTMAPFRLCAACRREYEDPADRRFHAEPTACPACGPRLRLLDGRGDLQAWDGDALGAAASALARGEVVAVKSVGGFHLACDAGSSAAVARLRLRKHREEKPFAVMVRSLEEAEALASLGSEERALLASPAAPIVLCRRRASPDGSIPAPPDGEREASLAGPGLARGSVAPPRTPPFAVAPEVAPGSPVLGLLLPYAPLHHLLLEAAGRPLVMTSGNRSEEPMARDEAEALDRLGGVADRFLVHDRAIAARADDSVAKVVLGAPLLLRRARGHVPGGVRLLRALAVPTLAAGASLKNAPALGAGDTVWLGPHVGDLEHTSALDAFEEAVAGLERAVRTSPRLLAHDLHPEYASTRWALARAAAAGVPAVAVQHHHAHAAAAMAEHRLPGPVLALAWDGAGLGDDGASWGGELLLARYEGYERLATFRPIALAGGDRAVREPWRLALAALEDAFDGAPPLERLPLFRAVEPQALRVVRRMIALGVSVTPAHGAGRLFDAVAALALGRPLARFEGQAATALDAAVDPAEGGAYPVDLDLASAPWRLDPRPLVRAAALDVAAGAPAGRVAARFHRGLARAAAALVRHAAALHGRLPVVLTGGCFANAWLVEELAHLLSPGLEVYPHRRVPPGDGGLALGQVMVADAVARCGG